ncbi:MAG: hypothetical protein LUG91_09030 [Ruminococcus sp.]|nr:hypothetical protein [Ruminococcus sp.]
MYTKADVAIPTLHFADDKALQNSLRYWQKMLHLEDWYIKAVLVDKLTDDDGAELSGQNIMTLENKEAFIKISRTAGEKPEAYMKHCDELTLVHELLHCSIVLMEKDSPTLEAASFALAEHQKIETLAKAFIMVRYGVAKDWFFKEEKEAKTNACIKRNKPD